MRLGQFVQLPASGRSVSSFLSNGTAFEREQDVLLYPCCHLPHRQQHTAFFAAIPHGAECGIECALLFRCWQLRDFQRMAYADLIGKKCLGDGRNQFRQAQSGCDVCLIASDLGGDSRNVVMRAFGCSMAL